MDKFCKDCKYCRLNKIPLIFAAISIVGWVLFPFLLSDARRFAKCTKFPRKKDGDYFAIGKGKSWYCSTQREKYGDCKPEAVYFEAK